MDAIFNGEIRGGHGAVEGDEAGLIVDPGLEGGVVAVGEEGFGMSRG